MSSHRPTIKGTYVLSHLKALVDEHGEEALRELGTRYGKPLDFKSDDDVSVSEEVAILENIVDMYSPKQLSPHERALLAGRLHFGGFASTPLLLRLNPLLRENIKTILLQSREIAEEVFQGVIFTAEDVGTTTIRIKLENNDYPLEHFQGFFEEWIAAAGQIGAVEAEMDESGVYIYTITWR